MIHARFDLEHWETVFPLSRLREEARAFVEARQAAMPQEYRRPGAFEKHVAVMAPGGEQVTGPRDMVVIEQLRAETLPSLEGARAVRTDVFVFARGEPENRAVTKIGGIPYWPTARPWPCTGSGQPRTFIGQFCFADSRDLVGHIPGDVLLLFGTEEAIVDNDPAGLAFEWIDLGADPLIANAALPPNERPIEPCYGVIHRTLDYPDQRGAFRQYHSSYLINVIEGTKIGGVPRWIQPPEELPGRFLCSMGSIDPQPYAQQPFPFINVEKPMSVEEDVFLVWGDVGSLYIFIGEGDQLHWTCQYY